MKLSAFLASLFVALISARRISPADRARMSIRLYGLPTPLPTLVPSDEATFLQVLKDKPEWEHENRDRGVIIGHGKFLTDTVAAPTPTSATIQWSDCLTITSTQTPATLDNAGTCVHQNNDRGVIVGHEEFLTDVAAGPTPTLAATRTSGFLTVTSTRASATFTGIGTCEQLMPPGIHQVLPEQTAASREPRRGVEFTA